MTPPGDARRAGALPGLWLATAVLTGLPALLLASFAEDASARCGALLLPLTAGVALASAIVIWTGVRRSAQVSLAASALVVVAAGSTLAVLSQGHVGLAGGLLFGGFGVIGAALAAVVAGWRLYRDKRTTIH